MSEQPCTAINKKKKKRKRTQRHMWLDASFVPNAIVMVTLPQPSLVGSHKRNTAHVPGIRAEPYVTTQPHAQMHRHTDGQTDRQTGVSHCRTTRPQHPLAALHLFSSFPVTRTVCAAVLLEPHYGSRTRGARTHAHADTRAPTQAHIRVSRQGSGLPSERASERAAV